MVILLKNESHYDDVCSEGVATPKGGEQRGERSDERETRRNKRETLKRGDNRTSNIKKMWDWVSKVGEDCVPL